MAENTFILQKGNIYFFYRPKVEHDYAQNLDDVQRLFVVLKPADKREHILLVIGKKALPAGENKETYFAFVEMVTHDVSALAEGFQAHIYHTSSLGKRKLPAVRGLAEGKYLLIKHKEKHVHLYYALRVPHNLADVHKSFGLKENDDFLVSVKNPRQPSPYYATLSPQQKAEYPERLTKKFQDYRFIPLDPPEFLEYAGSELLLIGTTTNIIDKNRELIQATKTITTETIKLYLRDIPDDISLTPIIEKRWQ
ncbi:MAG: hypothetical protein Tsb006_5370 [Rickettsiaceae bacterium]